MESIEKTVFISYRRINFPWALNIFQDLTHHGYDAFFDYQSIRAGDFDQVIIGNIKRRAHFLIVLTPSALERCNQPGDWLRREIETAMDEKRNIIPLMIGGFDFGSPAVKAVLTGKLATLSSYNGLEVPASYFFEAMTRLREQYLNVPLTAVLHPLSKEVEQITEQAQEEASLETVELAELSAQECFERAYQSQMKGETQEAIRLYQRAIELDPEFSDAYNNLGCLLYDMERFEETEQAYRKAIELNPDYAEAYSNLGLLLKNTDRLEEAEQAYRKAIELNPDDADYHNNLGILLKNTGRFEEAEQAYRKAIELNPDDADYHSNLGVLLEKTERFEEAEQAYRKAIKLNPEYARPYSNLGILLKKTDRLEESEQAYRKAIELNPEYASAYNNLGIVLRETGRLNEAEQAYRKAIELNPDISEAYDGLGVVLTNTKRYDETEQAFWKAIELDPEYDSAYYNMACLRSVQNKIEEGFDWLAQAFQKGFKDTDLAWIDTDLDNLRAADIARFTAIVGPKPEK